MKQLFLLLFCCNAGAFETKPDIDFKKPIYAREAAVVCESRHALMLAINAINANWHYIATAGIKPPKPLKQGQKIMPEDIGCKSLPNGWPLVFVGDQFTSIETTSGFTIRQMIRN